MHQIRFSLGLSPKLHWRTYSTPHTPTVFKGPTSRGKDGKGMGGNERGKGGGDSEKCEAIGPAR